MPESWFGVEYNNPYAILVSKGDKNDTVLAVQQMLNLIGYNVRLDGYYDQVSTTMAVRAFQEASDLPEHDYVDQVTYDKLKSTVEVSPTNVPTTTSSVTNTTFTPPAPAGRSVVAAGFPWWLVALLGLGYLYKEQEEEKRRAAKGAKK